MPLVQIQNLDFSYGANAALRDISLDVEAGSTLGLIGPNGGGKTTLLQLMLGLLRPACGAIVIDGRSPAAAVRAGNIVGYLPQNPRVADDFPLDVRQTVRLGLAGKTGLLRSASRDDLSFADSLIERVGLTDQMHEPIGSLSGGMLQRALIARALAPRPKLLLLDEPTVGIDPSQQKKFLELLDTLKSKLGLTIVLVSHDLRAVTAVADRIGCLNLTLHYHDRPSHLPAELVFSMFHCDLEAMGVKGHCSHPGHGHTQ